MAKGKNKPKLTNKQIEHHLNQLYFLVERLIKVNTLYIEFNKHSEEFEKFVEKKNKTEK